MAERRVVLDEKKNKPAGGGNGRGVKKKKKMNGCCSCILGTFIMLVVILAAGVGVGWYFGDKYTKENFNMSLGECFSVAGGLYSPNEDKIVTNGYSDADLDDFYTQLKHAVFLQEKADVSVETIYGLIKEGTRPAVSSLKAAAENTDAPEGGTQAGEQTQPDALTKYLTALLTKENVDFERLKAYDESKHEEYLLKIKDRGVAAFVNKLLVMILADTDSVKQLTDKYGIENVTDYIELNQIILARETRAVGVSDGAGQVTPQEKEVTTLKLTAHVALADAAKPVLDKLIDNSFLYSLAHFAVKAVLPNDVYLTAGMGLSDDVGLDVYVNNIDSPEKTAQAFKLIDGIMAQPEGSLRKEIEKIMTDNVRPYLEQAEQFVDFSSVSDHTLSIDPFAAVIQLTGLNEGAAEENKLTGADVLGTLSNVLTADYGKAVSPEHAFAGQHTCNDPAADGYSEYYHTVYNPALVDESTLVDYRDEFLKEVAAKYLINLDPDGVPGSGDEIGFNDFMALLGIGDSNKKPDLMSLIDGKRMTEILGEEQFEKLNVEVNDRMMGAIVSSALDSILSASDFAAYDVSLVQIIMREEDVGGSGDVRQFLEIGIGADVTAMTGGITEPLINSLLTAFLPERVMLSVNMDITKNLAGRQPVKTEIRYNDLTAAETDKILGTVGKLAPSLSIEQLMTQLETPLRDTLNGMYSLMDSIRFTQSKVVLPNVFKLMEELLFTQADAVTGERRAVVTGEQIKDMLNAVIGSDDENYLSAQLGIDEAAADYNGFLSEIKSKYYINSNLTINTFDDIFSVVDLGNFNSASFDIERLKTDNRPASELTPVFTDREMAHMFQEAMTSGAQLSDLAGIKGISIRNNGGNPYIRLAIEMKLSALGDNVASLLPVSRVYVVATCYVGQTLTDENGAQFYRTDITLGRMNDEQKQTLEKMLSHLQGGAAIDFDAQSRELGKLIYNQMQTIRSALGDDGFRFVETEQGGKTVGGIQLMSFYEFLAKATGLDTTDSKYGDSREEVIDNVKGALQGLYERGQSGNQNNFDPAEIVTSPAVDVDLTSLEGIAASFETVPVPPVSSTGKMADNRFAGYLKASFENQVGVLEQLSILNAGNVKGEAARQKIAGFGTTLDAAKDYMLLIVSVDIVRLSGASGVIGSFLPGKLYVSLCVDLSDMSCVMTRINSLTARRENVLFAIAGLDAAQLDATVSDALAIIGKYSGAGFVDSVTEGAIGSIETTFELPGGQA